MFYFDSIYHTNLKFSWLIDYEAKVFLWDKSLFWATMINTKQAFTSQTEKCI